MCPDCKDTGVVQLLTSTVVCECRKKTVASPGGGHHQVDEACFGTINGVTLSQQIAFDIETHRDPLTASEEMVANAPALTTFTLEVETRAGKRQYTGLNKHQIDFVHACLRAGWDADRVAEHLEEEWTAARVRMSDEGRLRIGEDLERAGYSVNELRDVAAKIEERLFSVEDDGEAERIIFDEIACLILRKVIHKALGAVIDPLMKMPLATGGIVSKDKCAFSFVPETCFGVNPGTMIPNDRKPAPVVTGTIECVFQAPPGFIEDFQAKDRAFRKGIGFVATNAQCGKAEFYRRMFGGKPDPSIDTSAFELRALARLQENPNERSADPGSAPASPDAG